MDHASFALRQHLLVLHQAGIRHLLPGPSSPDHGRSASGPVAAGHVDHTGAGQDTPPSFVSALDQEPWAGFLARIPQGARSIWTYEGLGQDLSGQPSALRRQTLGRLLAAARLPKGFVGFFPYSLPRGEALDRYENAFLEALALLAPANAVLFDDSRQHPLVQALSCSGIAISVLQYPSLEIFAHMSDTDLQDAAVRLRNSIFQSP